MHQSFRSALVVSLAVVLASSLGSFAVPACAQPAQQQAPPADDSSKPKQKAPPPEPVTIFIEVSAGDKDKPVEGASIYVRYPEPHKFRSDTLAEMNVKTTPEGKARVPLVPKGKILIQIVAPGWKTFGKWFDLTDDKQVFKIHLDRPPKWY